jgi:nucleoside-diphosphate-sugar epimerase
MKTVLITGSGGLVAKYMAVFFSDFFNVIETTRADMDLRSPCQSPHHVDYIIHCASNRYGTLWECLQDNVIGTAHLLEWAKKQKNLENFIYISSADVLGPGSEPKTEDSPCDPRSEYAATKAAGEALCRSSGLPVSICRPVNIICPELSKKKFPYMCTTGEHLTINEGRRSYIHVDDLSAHILFIIQNKLFGNFNITGETISNIDLALRIGQALKKEVSYSSVCGSDFAEYAVVNTRLPLLYRPIDFAKICGPKSTVICHIFNEEYLLPFWLRHHKKIFDNGIIIDYNSTDRSVSICKSICPHWKVIQSRNTMFDAEAVDAEVMDIERTLDGIKMSINVTEFLFCEKPLFKLLPKPNMCIFTETLSPYSTSDCDPQTNKEIYQSLISESVFYHCDRLQRTVHSFPCGNYGTGRHRPEHAACRASPDIHVVWLGFHPYNDLLCKRKVQIGDRIPQKDKDRGFGVQHYTLGQDDFIRIRKEKVLTGQSVELARPSLKKIIEELINDSSVQLLCDGPEDRAQQISTV